MTIDQIEIKKAYLEQLEKSEEEARRLDGALAAAGIPGRRRLGEEGEGEGADSTTEGSGSGLIGSRVGGSSVSVSGGAGLRKSTSSGSGGYGFLSALSHSITGMMDVDPEATRRNNISKTRDTISQVCLLPTPFAGLRSFADPFCATFFFQLEDALYHVQQDLKYASQTIQADLDRFQRQKVKDMRDMCLNLATAHRDWCKQVRR